MSTDKELHTTAAQKQVLRCAAHQFLAAKRR